MIPSQTDVIVPMTLDYMDQLITRQKPYECRRYRISPSVKRIWFYLTAPHSCIAYICEIDPITARNDSPSMEETSFSYTLKSVWRIWKSLGLREMKKNYGLKVAPRGLMYVPTCILDAVPWREQQCLWKLENKPRRVVTTPQPKPTLKRKVTREDSLSFIDGVHHKLLKMEHGPRITRMTSDDRMDVDS
ncbi:hypothetical protein WG66_008484 [Moniliophthora roreri]|nr:hypothetical protein WG66_008484 [Moniliophthora roreri]